MLGHNFCILFDEKEGTSPLVRLLANFDGVSLVHQEGNKGWEPFDRHICGAMSTRRLGNCLDLIFNTEPADMENLNRIYMKTAPRPLANIDKDKSIGFKMRFRPPGLPDLVAKALVLPTLRYRRLMFDLFKRHDVVVFMAIRRDIFRWAFSKYHGDGTGKKGHLQFRLAAGQISENDIPKIHVDLRQFEKTVATCERIYDGKRRIVDRLNRRGITTYPLFYEDFCGDKQQYFSSLLGRLNVSVTETDIEDAIEQGAYLKKVHSDDISQYVVNYKELFASFGTRVGQWF